MYERSHTPSVSVCLSVCLWQGVPDYVYDLCAASEPAGTPSFPLPAVNATYPQDQDGNPTLDSCLSVMFATYYL